MSKNKPKNGPPPQKISEAPEAAINVEQIELEICWCIRELENKLNEGKLNPKQTQDVVKAIGTLGSSTAALIKKRQIMRTYFKDYKSLMADQVKKQGKVNQSLKLKPVDNNIKSSFIKKRMRIDKQTEDIDASTGHIQKLENSFQFNFDIVN